MNVSVAAPAFNEEKIIRDVLLKWDRYLALSKNVDKYEICICNDGSTDQTLSILNKLKNEITDLKITTLKENSGASVALKNAIKLTTYEYVLLIDTDDQFLISSIDTLIPSMKKDISCVIGSRISKNDSIFLRFGSFISGFICNLIYGSKLKDFNSALKLIRGDIVRNIFIDSKGLNYSTEITAKILEKKLIITEVNVKHFKRLKGNSSVKIFRDSLQRFLFIFYLFVRKILIKTKTLSNKL